jgi:hypothetical protein
MSLHGMPEICFGNSKLQTPVLVQFTEVKQLVPQCRSGLSGRFGCELLIPYPGWIQTKKVSEYSFKNKLQFPLYIAVFNENLPSKHVRVLYSVNVFWVAKNPQD